MIKITNNRSNELIKFKDVKPGDSFISKTGNLYFKLHPAAWGENPSGKARLNAYDPNTGKIWNFDDCVEVSLVNVEINITNANFPVSEDKK